MSLLVSSLLPLLKFRVHKSRPDGYSDQYNRIFMVKICLTSCIILSLNWLKDSIGCIIPETSGMDKGYVTQACWIQGLYIYKDYWNQPEFSSKYYGIPKELIKDGLKNDGELCIYNADDPRDCEPMNKVFYNQYQWFPFFMGAMAALFYLPYFFFCYVNRDLISLKKNVKAEKPDVDKIIDNYFNYQINPKSRMKLRLIGNIIGKIFYIMVNIIAFVATDNLLNNDFRGYGKEMINWNKESNDMKLDYTATREKFRQGDRLLPSFAICQVLELAKDIKHTLFNKHTFVCEISQNVLYQYMLMLIWFLYILGVIVSIFGLLRLLVDQCITRNGSVFVRENSLAKKVYDSLTVRECQYLEYIRNKKLVVFNEVMEKLREQRGDLAMEMPDVPKS